MPSAFWKLFFALCGLIPIAPAYALSVKLDLGLPPQGYVVRDGFNGQWRGGFNKPLAHIERNGVHLLDIGYARTWNAEHGNPANGVAIGKEVHFSDMGSMMGLGSLGLPPFIGYLDKVTAMSLMGATMFNHTADVRTATVFSLPVIWGVGAMLDLSDVLSILQKGL